MPGTVTAGSANLTLVNSGGANRIEPISNAPLMARLRDESGGDSEATVIITNNSYSDQVIDGARQCNSMTMAVSWPAGTDKVYSGVSDVLI